MKHILVLCCLYFVTILSYANTCPPSPDGYIFRVAAWGDHVGSTSQVRCHYYYRNNESKHIEIWTNEFFHEADISKYPQWHTDDDHRYSLCTSHNIDVKECPFG